MAGEKAHPKVRAMRAQDFLDPRETRAVQVLFVAVGVLLLIACANVANLLMSRAWTRRREFAVRVALGAGRARLARQVLTESVMLALAGGFAGVVVAMQTLRIIIALRPPSLGHLAGARVETPVLCWSAGISVLTGILFGCGPAFFAGARRAGDILKNESRAGSGGNASHRMRSALIVAEIALSLVLLVGAGLLVRSFSALQRMPLGFEPRGLVSMFVLIMGPRETRAADGAAILARLRVVPGVIDASIGSMPAEGLGVRAPLGTDPGATGHARTIPSYSVGLIDANYFRVTRIALLEGRLPDSAALALPASVGPPGSVAAPFDVVINRSLAQRLWPSGGAVGSRLHSEAGRSKETYTVVGVVDDARIAGTVNPAREAQVYRRPLPGGPSFIVRTTMPGASVVPALRKAVTDAAPHSYVQTVTVGEQFVSDALAPAKFAMALLTAFSVVALALSVVGLYGVIAYSVTQRTREIGIRVALGAAPSAVTGLVVGSGLRLTVAGVLIGVVAAMASTQLLSSLLFAVAPADPATFVGIAVIVAAIALLASYVPARRALSIDPMEALRAD
jgi:putative ABC transport system permease protein